MRRRLFFLSGFIGSQVLFTVDLVSATVSSKSIASPDIYVFFEFSPQSASAIPATGTVAAVILAGVLAVVGCVLARRVIG